MANTHTAQSATAIEVPAQTIQLTQEWDKVFPQSDKVTHRKVTFKNRYGITLATLPLYRGTAVGAADVASLSEAEARAIADADPMHSGLDADEVHHRLASIADDIRHVLVDPDAIVRNDRDVKLGDYATVVRVLSTLSADQVRRVVAGCCSKLNLWGRAF